MSNFINAGVEELKERLKINHEEIGYLETRLDRAKSDNKKLEEENKFLKEENKRLREELDKKNMETWFYEKTENIYKSQKGDILM